MCGKRPVSYQRSQHFTRGFWTLETLLFGLMVNQRHAHPWRTARARVHSMHPTVSWFGLDSKPDSHEWILKKTWFHTTGPQTFILSFREVWTSCAAHDSVLPPLVFGNRLSFLYGAGRILIFRTLRRLIDPNTVSSGFIHHILCIKV